MKNYFFIALTATLLLSSCTKDNGSISMTFNKATANYGNLEEVRNTPLLEASRSIENPGKIFIGEEYLLIGEEGNGIHIFDNTNPSSPTNVAYMNIPFCKEFFVKDNFIYAESQYDMLKIDISNTASPFMVERAQNSFATPLENENGQQLIGFSYETVTEKIKLNSTEHETLSDSDHLYYDYAKSLIPPSAVPSSFSGSSAGAIGTVNRITAHEGYVYAVSHSKIFVFNDQGGFSKSNTIETGEDLETIFPQGENLFLGTRNSMEIYNISNPETPSSTSSFWHTTACDPVLPNNDVAYVTIRTGDFSNCPGDVNALLVLDIDDVQNPSQREQIELESPYGMCINGQRLYVGNGENGLKIFDISDRFNPVSLGTDATVKAYDVIIHPTIPNLILTSGPNGIEQYDYNPETLNMQLISHIPI